MKIPGSFFELDLIINNDNLIEFKIIKNKEIKYSVNPMDFSEIEYDLQSFLEDKGVFLPKNRFKLVLESLEVIYMDLTQQQKKMKERGFIKPEDREQPEISSYKPIKPIQKVLLMGGKGKSSIYQVIFEGKLPHETNTIKPTRGIEKHEISFPSLTDTGSSQQKLLLWDFGSKKLNKDDFRNGTLLLFVVDAFDVNNYELFREQLHETISMMKLHGSRPKFLARNQSNIFCFIHKMDLFTNAGDQYKSLVEYFRINPKTKEKTYNIKFFATSIFDSTIYGAWAKIIEILMPKSSKLNQLSNKLKEDLGLYATMIIEKRTGLPVASSKTLLDDNSLVGSTNRILILTDKVLPEYELSALDSLKIETANGILEIRIFEQFYVLIMIYPPHERKISTPEGERILQEFIQTLKKIFD
jgi:Ras-related GTP-binding protein A/B